MWDWDSQPQSSRYIVNTLLLVLIAWCIPWYVYNRFIRTKEFHPMGTHVPIPTPQFLSCAIPYVSRNPKKNDCTKVKFDLWSVGHVLIYATIGMVLPGYWLPVLILSILCEAFEYIVGWRARWLIDPIANLFGYAIGHMVYVKLTMPWLVAPIATVYLSVALAIILLLNRPAAIPRGEEFY